MLNTIVPANAIVLPETSLSRRTMLGRIYPVFDEELARRLFALHLVLMLNLIDEMNLCYRGQDRESFTEAEVEALNLAVKLMNAEGMVEPNKIVAD